MSPDILTSEPRYITPVHKAPCTVLKMSDSTKTSLNSIKKNVRLTTTEEIIRSKPKEPSTYSEKKINGTEWRANSSMRTILSSKREALSRMQEPTLMEWLSIPLPWSTTTLEKEKS